MYVDKMRLMRKRGGILRIYCGWCVEMCDIKNYFDKHCLLIQKRLSQSSIKIILYKFAIINYIYMTFIYQTVSECIAAIQIGQYSPFDFYWYNQSTKIGSYLHFIRFFQSNIQI